MSVNDKLEKIEEKLDKLTEKLHDTNLILAENTKSLIIHEKRTDIAEKKLEIVQQRLDRQMEREGGILREIDQKIAPIKTHVDMVNLTFKYIIPTISAAVLFFYKLGILKL
jgi:Skp family chaperone for outer membrane proteins